MSTEIESQLRVTPLIALVQADDARTAVHISQALVTGGVCAIEVLLRTDAALDCLAAVVEEVPDAMVGAGTVLSAVQAEAALAAGARFVVSPGLDEAVVDVARGAETPVYPGVATAGELQRAHNMGLKTVKFFPASIAGGIPAIKALSSVFRTMRFIPTGGVSASNLADFLAPPAVFACGGSWMTPAEPIRRGDFNAIENLARQAVEIARKSRQR